MPWDPMKGERLAPAWKAASEVLADGAWHHWTEVLDAMTASSDLQEDSCKALLYAGISKGHIRRQGEYNFRRRRDGRWLRREA